MRFLIRFGETRTLLRKNEPGSCVEPVAVTGKREPLPTIMDEGEGYREKEVCERVLGSEVIWDVAPESKYQSLVAGCWRFMVLKEEANDC
jgi:hypothetical protein